MKSVKSHMAVLIIPLQDLLLWSRRKIYSSRKFGDSISAAFPRRLTWQLRMFLEHIGSNGIACLNEVASYFLSPIAIDCDGNSLKLTSVNLE